jgi:hypothetical protein
MNLKSLARAFTSNIGGIAVSPEEQTALAAKGINEPTIQKYVLWRRATILMVVIGTALSAIVSTISTFTEEDQPNFVDSISDSVSEWIEKLGPEAAKLIPAEMQKAAGQAADKVKNQVAEKAEKDENAGKPGEEAKADNKDKEKSDAGDEDEEEQEIKFMGKVMDYVQLGALYLLPIVAIVVLLLGNRFQLSFRLMAIAFGISFFLPMLLALCPWSWWGVHEETYSAAKNPILFAKDQAEGALEAASILGALLPSVLSLIPGIQKACLRIKTIIPQALLPGWFIVVASPLYGLFLVVVMVAVDQFTGEPAILVPLALLAAASLTYAVRANVFTRPYISEADFRRAKGTQMIVTIMTALAGVILVYFLLTREVMGVHALGNDPKTSLMRPIELVDFIVQTIGRSMFVSALGAEFIFRMSLGAWRQNRSLTESTSATAYDSAMAAGEIVLGGSGK